MCMNICVCVCVWFIWEYSESSVCMCMHVCVCVCVYFIRECYSKYYKVKCRVYCVLQSVVIVPAHTFYKVPAECMTLSAVKCSVYCTV